MYMYVRHVITRRKPITACAEIAIFLAICEEIAFLPCPNTAKIRHGQGRLEHPVPCFGRAWLVSIARFILADIH